MRKFNLFSIVLCLSLTVSAQQPFSPKKINFFGPIQVQKPVLLDSTNLKDKKFSDETLLDYNIAFPAPERFTQTVLPDTAGFFHFSQPTTGYAFHLLSFFVSADRYGKGKMKITSPNMLEVYVDNERKNTKTGVSDSLKNAGSVEHTLDGNIINKQVVIKLLASSEEKLYPAVKIELKPEKEDSLLAYSFSESDFRPITIIDILDGTRVSSSSISASGKFVLLKLTQTLPGGKRNQLVQVYDVEEKRTVFSENSDRSQLNWMPKSNLLYYVADSENGKTMYTLNPITSETKIIAENLPDESFYFAPDEKSMFFMKKETLSIDNPNKLKRLLAPDDRQPNYRNRYFIYRYMLDSGLAQQITFGKETASLNDISADSKYILFSTSKETITQRPFGTSSMYRLNLENMRVDTLWSNQAFVNSAQFSPNGNDVLTSGGAEAFNGIGQNVKSGQIANSYDGQAFIMNIATREVEPITKNFNPAVSSLHWNPVDKFIYIRVKDKDCENVYRYNPKNRKFDKLPLRENVIRRFDFAQNAPFATYTGQNAQNSNRSYVINLNNNQSTLISDPYASQLAKLNLGKVEDWSFNSKFGDTIDGRFYLPPNFDANKKYPLIVYYYGGTSPTQRTFEGTYPLNVYAAQGYVVYTLNPSGTTGYGQEFAARHVNAWGKQTADEIIEGTKKFVAAHPFIDGAKIGCIGASYGGFMTQYLQTQTDLFAAAVSHAGISDITSYWGEGYWGYAYSAGASAGSYPWNNPDLYVGQSPLFQADKIKTPLLLLHGTADTNVPIGESIQMYNALKILGKPVEFIQVEGENHAIYDYDKRIQWNYAIYAWFDKWLKGDSRWWDAMYPEK